MAHVIPTEEAHHTIDPNREVINRLQDFLNNPATRYSPSGIWHEGYIELRPWPFQTGTGREGTICHRLKDASRPLFSFSGHLSRSRSFPSSPSCMSPY